MRIAAGCALCAGVVVWAFVQAGPAAAQGPADSHAQFVEAQRIQENLEQRPAAGRTLAAYQMAVAAYRKVYFNMPAAQDAPRALMQIGALYQEMGARFDKKYFHAAIVSYDFLLRGYPGSDLRAEAAFAIARIEQRSLHARHDAEVSYRDFLRLFPDSPRSGEARVALAQLHGQVNGSQEDEEEAVADATAVSQPPARNVPSRASSGGAVFESPTANQSGQWRTFSKDQPVESDGSPAQVSEVHSQNGVGHTRVVVSLDRPVTFGSGRAHNPERIFFDISNARVAAGLAAQPLAVNDSRVKTVRLAQNRQDVVRIVLDVNMAANCAAYLLRDPDRLVIDVQDAGTPILTEARGAEIGAEPPSDGTAAASGPVAGDEESAASGSVPVRNAALNDSRIHSSNGGSSNGGSPDSGTTEDADRDEPAALHTRDVAVHASSIPQPLRGGNRSLTRELGLKISRIVIDAGHGGHDTGTIGPHGVAEKTVCLDVALRLGKLIQKRLPGAKVVYTRKDDTFVPLEERTAIANREKADLFISIHANSSPSESARGVETYYLNFATSPDAMEVATRENAEGASSVHELQSMIQKIARNEKVDESREFAADVQQALYRRLQTGSPGMEDRGVKRAPFVVLIGAHMPSILSEIAFLSNPTDERLLSQSTERQRVAEGLYRGVESYLASLNSLAVNDNGPSPREKLVARGNQK